MSLLRLDSVNGSPVVEYRITTAGITRRTLLPNGKSGRDGGSAWAIVTRSELLALPVDGEVWVWLRERGARRPSPSGPSGRTPSEAERREAGRVRLAARVSTETADRVAELAEAWGCTPREVIERLVAGARNAPAGKGHGGEHG